MLEIQNLVVNYGHINALSGVSLQVEEGKLVSIIGSNGAGKSTLLNTISGLVKKQSGKILYRGRPLTSEAHRVVRQGIAQVPEGRKIFPGLSVRENLVVGGFYLRGRAALNRKIDEMFELFPRLGERSGQEAGTMSGGEQQMLAVCRALMSGPKLLLLDEPSLGLAPVLVNDVFKLVKKICSMGITVLLVEQNAKKALGLCDHAYVFEHGVVTLQGKGEELLCNDEINRAYLGDTGTCDELEGGLK
jgi:branched-chain amino acid transport system ATP-binding protein